MSNVSHDSCKMFTIEPNLRTTGAEDVCLACAY